MAVEPTTDKRHLEQGQHHDAHEAARRAPSLWKGRTACLRPAGSVAARRIGRGGVYERWRAAGTERRMSQSRARGQRWTHGLRGRVEHERVRVRPRGLRRVAGGGTCHTHGAHGEGEEPRSRWKAGTRVMRVYRGVMFRARAYADGLEHPRLWGIAGTVSSDGRSQCLEDKFGWTI